MTSLPPWIRSLGPLVLADLRRRYAGSVLGALWAILAPVLEAVVYGVVFGLILGASGRTGMPYAVLIASGLFPWASFREALEGCASVLPDNRWIRRSRVPMELLVARLVLVSLPRAIVAIAVVLAFAAIGGLRPSLVAWFLPFVALALQALGAYFLGVLVAPTATLFPDLKPTLISLLTLFTFASPILYPETIAHGTLATILRCNPFTHLLRLYRSPVEPLEWDAALLSLAVSLGAVLCAWAASRIARARVWWRARDAL
jgi:ABC-type polysaccharide/polyol phosphate export permease